VLERHPLPISFVIADDHPLIRQGLRQVIERNSGYVVTAEAADGAEVLKIVEASPPDVLILDIDMPVLNGLDVLRILHTRVPRPQIVCLSLHNQRDMIDLAFRYGASAFLLKESALPELQQGVHEVLSGRQYISPLAALKRVTPVSDGEGVGAASLQLLTPTERLVLRMVAMDRTSKEIADELAIHFRTVENHRSNICKKLELNGSNALLRYALQHRGEI
jgi:DNA-binding NarL/FixJ family response regulator